MNLVDALKEYYCADEKWRTLAGDHKRRELYGAHIIILAAIDRAYYQHVIVIISLPFRGSYRMP
jgi:hypothetical protein